MTYNLMSWNVNGIRAAVKNGFVNFLKTEQPEVLGLQEIKITNAAREKEEFDFAGYDEYWHPAKRPGYSGTAVLTKVQPITYHAGIGDAKFDDEGRVQTLEFEKFYFVNCYFPNANHELSRLDYKEEFNATFLKYVKKLEQKKPVIICGDFNVAHREIDLARPKENEGNAGFTDEERKWADKFLEHGLVDTFRLLNPEKIQYSWWSYRHYARDRNIGWRIDYFLVSKILVPKIKKAFILDEVIGSDHAPVGIEIEI
jgi:exodeoxyribonuclease-3